MLVPFDRIGRGTIRPPDPGMTTQNRVRQKSNFSKSSNRIVPFKPLAQK